jgi:hypothetical protein
VSRQIHPLRFNRTGRIGIAFNSSSYCPRSSKPRRPAGLCICSRRSLACVLGLAESCGESVWGKLQLA